MIGQRIQIDTNTWVVTREFPDRPKAVIQRVENLQGISRFLLFTWHPDPAQRRMVDIFDTIHSADKAVPGNKLPAHPSRGYSDANVRLKQEEMARQQEGSARARPRAGA